MRSEQTDGASPGSGSAPIPVVQMDFDRIEVGQKTSLQRRILYEDLEAFARLSGDFNPLHMDAAFARRTMFQRQVVHGMLVSSYVSTLIGMHLPGPGALWNQQSFQWLAPVFVGDELEVTLAVTHKSAGTRMLTIEVSAVNQHGSLVMSGKGAVMLMEQQQREKDRPLAGRLAVVTGGSRGIGAAIVAALADSGATVVVNYLRSRATAEDLVKGLADRGCKSLAVQADVTDPVATRSMFQKVTQQFGQPVGVLVNNASGAIQAKSFTTMPWADMQCHLDTQLRGAFNCCQEVIPNMVEQKSGRIVNIGSIFTWAVPPPNLMSYVAAKAALKAFTRSLAVEFSPKGVRINMVSPGMTETELIADIPERLRKVQAMQTPLRRLAHTEDVARAVVFLCSEGGEFITGADLPVCGGAMM